MISMTLDYSAPAFWKAHGLERALVKSINMGGRDALRTMKSQGNKYVRGRKKLKVARVNKALTDHKPKNTKTLESLVWELTVSSAPVPLADYPHRQGPKGVTVQVNVGKKTLIESAFTATMRSGHTGVFRRRGQARLPVDELFSSRVSDVFHDNGMIHNLQGKAQTAFQTTFDRVFPMNCAKGKQ